MTRCLDSCEGACGEAAGSGPWDVPSWLGLKAGVWPDLLLSPGRHLRTRVGDEESLSSQALC